MSGKLRTLADLTIGEGYTILNESSEDTTTTDFIVSYNGLRDEAKEWLKVNPEDYPEEIYVCPKCEKIMETDCEGCWYCFKCDYSCFDVECWIRYFFNLKEDK